MEHIEFAYPLILYPTFCCVINLFEFPASKRCYSIHSPLYFHVNLRHVCMYQVVEKQIAEQIKRSITLKWTFSIVSLLFRVCLCEIVYRIADQNPSDHRNTHLISLLIPFHPSDSVSTSLTSQTVSAG